ncbi:sialidase family protein [Massilia terrae]|uniref:Glycoside hydrolase n=1 Tax=Massilia terrae TaxID=1811224 RepID=A0ABT2CZE4_9BURK|nr:sialidase family protein [Massilia terrae]MCS0659337.1 glycoside hydrolase [Massilia terrae]
MHFHHTLLALALVSGPVLAQGHHHAGRDASLGTSAAVDPQGRLWIARTEPAAQGAYVVLQSTADLGKTWSVLQRVQQAPETIEAAGESAPKIAFGPTGQVYVSYTHPLGKPYTGEIRFARSVDGGKSFSAPATVHADRAPITHRFDSLIVDRAGRVFVAWIDKRDAEAARARQQPYAGAAVYYAVSDDAGASFKGDYKLAEHSCECCRIALALDKSGAPVAMYRAVFGKNVRDHAIAALSADGKPTQPVRASFDDWHIDACPHHGPGLAFAPDGSRHQVWFDVAKDQGGVFYASATPAGKLGKPVRLGSDQAEHADVAVDGAHIAVVWKQFDGEATAILLRNSLDGGKTWQEKTLAHTAGNSDHPHLLRTPSGIVLVWRTQDEGVRVLPAT